MDGNANLNGHLRNVNPGAKTRRFERRGLSESRQVTRRNFRFQNDAFLIDGELSSVAIVTLWCFWLTFVTFVAFVTFFDFFDFCDFWDFYDFCDFCDFCDFVTF